MSRDLAGLVLLLIDPDSGFLRQAKSLFTHLGAKVHLAHGLEDALSVLSVERVQLVCYDCDLPFSGAELKENYQQVNRGVIFFALVKDRSSQLEAGIDGFLLKPLDATQVIQALENNSLSKSLTVSTLDPLAELLRPYLLYRSPAMRTRLSLLPKIAASNYGVMITGETGTGKEVIARAVHHLSGYKKGPFIAVNCGAIPESLIEGELFGHEKGAFTGANVTHKGKFELADGGTLFLDEIGEMPLLLQSRLLRVLEEREIYRVGGEKSIEVDVRVLAATQVDLAQAVDKGLFREDLYYRLNILPIHLPPLRERVEDVALLAWHFLERAFLESNRPAPYPSLTDLSIELLSNQPWPGNVRELRNLMTRVAVLLPSHLTYIEPKHLLAYFPEANISSSVMGLNKERVDCQDLTTQSVIELSSVGEPLTNHRKEGIFIPYGTTLAEVERRMIGMTLEKNSGNKTESAQVLGVSLRTLRRRTNETS